jgi:hypothetical protein
MENPANNPNFIWETIERMEADPEFREAVHALFYRGELKWLLHDGQLEMLRVVEGTEHHEILIFCSRQIGKSFFIIIVALMHSLSRSRALVRIFAETEIQIADIVNDNLQIIEQLAPPGLIDRKKSDKRWLINGPLGESQIRLGMLSAAHVDGKRGGNATLIILEEGGFSPSDTYKRAIGGTINAQLLRSSGRLVHVTTPSEDMNHYVHTEVLPKCEVHNAVARLDIHKNPQLTEKQIELARSRCTTAEEWMREYLVQIVKDQISTVVPEFSREIHVREMKIPAYTYWMTSLDFGGTVDKHGLLRCFYDFERAKFCVWDERFLERNTPTKEIIAAGLDLEKGIKWLSSGPYRISDCPGQVMTDLNAEGYYVTTPDKEKGSWEAGINAIRMAFSNEQIEIHPRCVNLIATLDYGQFTKTRKDFQRTEQLGHLDLLAALIYGFRAKLTGNPFPPHLGKSRYTHFLSKQDQENKTALEEAFKPG